MCRGGGGEDAFIVEKKLSAIERLRGKLQGPPKNSFDRSDLQWEEITNCSQGQCRQTFVAFILWNRLYNFVDGESSTRDFPCTFLEVPVKVQKGVIRQVRESSYTQKIRYDTCPILFTQSPDSFCTI